MRHVMIAGMVIAAGCSSSGDTSPSATEAPDASAAPDTGLEAAPEDSEVDVPDETVTTDVAEPVDDVDIVTDVEIALRRPDHHGFRSDNYTIGGDALIVVDDKSIDAAFSVDASPLDATLVDDGIYLVSGLPDGESTISLDGTDATVSVDNYPTTGPVFSGPHQEPLFCTFESFGLESAGDDNCSVETSVRWGYVGDDGAFVEAAEAPDADTLFIRLEEGTINRGIYQFAVAEPTGDDASIASGKDVVYRFGGGCGTGHTQGANLGSSVLDEEALAAGYIVATSTFNTLQTHCNDVLSAETLMMVQEHIDETLGPIGLTIGRGGSGGAIQQYAIAQNYPGLLDALSVAAPFPDSASISGGVTDCGLLLNFWTTDAGATFDDAARTAIQGHGTEQFCSAWNTTFLSNVNPSAGCASAIPEEEIYDAASNPSGIRCTLQDSASNLFGVDDQGFGRRALDNVGIEYGRNALMAGLITVDQFLDLNEAIGGYDLDGAIGPDRTEADSALVEEVYAEGRVLRGDSAVADIPVIDIDPYSDLTFDIHDRFRSFTIRARITGDPTTPSENRVIWSRPGGGLVTTVTGEPDEEAPATEWTPTAIVDALAEWVSSGERPEGVADDCIIDGVRVFGDDALDPGSECSEAYPYFGDPRTAAGAPIENDIIKCATVPVDASTYGVEFSSDQAERLAAVFPNGVCDYTEPGVGQVELRGTWLTY